MMTAPSMLTLFCVWFQTTNFELGWVLAGLGALAGGIGIFRAGMAMGRGSARFVDTFERVVTQHLEGQERLIAIGDRAVQVLPAVMELKRSQDDMGVVMRAMNRKLGRVTGDMESDAERS